MYNFFVKKENLKGDVAIIDGGDFNHIKNVLRMKEGDEFLISEGGTNSLCKIVNFESECVVAKIVEKNYLDTSLPIEIYLFQGLIKSDKFELVIQKAVELGANKIIPVQMERCVAKIEQNKVNSKTERFNAIAESAAKQCKRDFIPQVEKPMSLKDALDFASSLDLLIVPYENQKGILSTKEALSLIKKGYKVGVLIGPEGGFSDKEIELAKKMGCAVSLGKRILRAETASFTALSMLMLYAEMNLD